MTTAKPAQADPEGIAIKALGHDDFEVWLPLWRGYQVFYGADIAADVTRLTFARLLDPGEPMAGALAFVGASAVGLVHTVTHRSTWTCGDYCYLQDLFTAESARGRGVARALIAHVAARAADAGCSRVYWITHETNARAMLLYDRVAERSGFVQYRKIL